MCGWHEALYRKAISCCFPQVLSYWFCINSKSHMLRNLPHFTVYVMRNCELNLYSVSQLKPALCMLPAVFVINQSNSCAAKNGLIPLNIFNEIFTDYFRHNLPLLLQILSSYLSLFGSSTTLNVKHDFSSAQTNKSDLHQVSVKCSVAGANGTLASS